MATASFPYVEIPKEVASVVGKCDEGTRMYRKEGSDEEAAHWFEAMEDIVGKAVSPGGVNMFCPVTRAAVHKRMKEGRLSAFLFHCTRTKKSWLGKERVMRERPFILIPVSEAKAWKEELEKEALRRGYVSKEELEGNEPDWHGEFLLWKNKKERMGYFDWLEQHGITITEAIKASIMMQFTGKYTYKPRKGKRK